MEFTKRIEIINVFKEKVVIEPVEYSVALKLIELFEEGSLLVEKASSFIVEQYKKGVENPLESEEVKRLMESRDKIELEEKELREKHNYYYLGLNNLKDEDIEKIKAKYPRRAKS